MRGLYISARYSLQTGGGLVTRSFRDALGLDNTEIDYFEFDIQRSKYMKLLEMFKGNILGMTHDIQNQILKILSQNKYDFVFINTSNFGQLIKKISRRFPSIKIITLCHNVEVYYIREAIRSERKLHKVLTYVVTYINEQKSIRYSDSIITLNKRDSDNLRKLYGRGASDIIPICLQDRFDITKLKVNGNKRPTGLFIGSNFYANLEGVRWFCKRVAPFVNADIIIVGKDFELNKTELEQNKNVTVVGTVNSIEDYYYSADFIFSPIFYGSGMKTKTAEAFMFGKPFFGTTEAFEGYDVEYDKVGALCNSDVEFIDAIENNKVSYIDYSRQLFLSNYSYESLVNKITDIIGRV